MPRRSIGNGGPVTGHGRGVFPCPAALPDRARGLAHAAAQGGAPKSYADGFVLPVPVENLEAYRKDARKAGKVWLEHGALQYMEAVADDVPAGKTTDFRRAVKRKDSETVVFAFAVCKSRKHRDQVMKKVMADPRMKFDPARLPFDGKRMFWGGFSPIVEMTAEGKAD